MDAIDKLSENPEKIEQIKNILDLDIKKYDNIKKMIDFIVNEAIEKIKTNENIDYTPELGDKLNEKINELLSNLFNKSYDELSDKDKEIINEVVGEDNIEDKTQNMINVLKEDDVKKILQEQTNKITEDINIIKTDIKSILNVKDIYNKLINSKDNETFKKIYENNKSLINDYIEHLFDNMDINDSYDIIKRFESNDIITFKFYFKNKDDIVISDKKDSTTIKDNKKQYNIIYIKDDEIKNQKASKDNNDNESKMLYIILKYISDGKLSKYTLYTRMASKQFTFGLYEINEDEYLILYDKDNNITYDGKKETLFKQYNFINFSIFINIHNILLLYDKRIETDEESESEGEGLKKKSNKFIEMYDMIKVIYDKMIYNEDNDYLINKLKNITYKKMSGRL